MACEHSDDIPRKRDTAGRRRRPQGDGRVHPSISMEPLHSFVFCEIVSMDGLHGWSVAKSVANSSDDSYDKPFSHESQKTTISVYFFPRASHILSMLMLQTSGLATILAVLL